MRRILTAFCVLGVTGCSTGSLVRSSVRQDDALIVPGHRVGSLVLGRTSAAEIGKGDGSVDETYGRQGLRIGLGDGMRVNAIEVTKRNYTTSGGLGVGDSASAVIGKLGTPELVDLPLRAGNRVKAFLARGALAYPGIIFLMNPAGRVASIVVVADVYQHSLPAGSRLEEPSVPSAATIIAE
jgi:hypothetical protein